MTNRTKRLQSTALKISNYNKKFVEIELVQYLLENK